MRGMHFCFNKAINVWSPDSGFANLPSTSPLNNSMLVRHRVLFGRLFFWQEHLLHHYQGQQEAHSMHLPLEEYHG